MAKSSWQSAGWKQPVWHGGQTPAGDYGRELCPNTGSVILSPN